MTEDKKNYRDDLLDVFQAGCLFGGVLTVVLLLAAVGLYSIYHAWKVN